MRTWITSLLAMVLAGCIGPTSRFVPAAPVQASPPCGPQPQPPPVPPPVGPSGPLVPEILAGGHSHDYPELPLTIVKTDGSRPFTGVIEGITPVASTHLATKGYVDGAIVGGGADDKKVLASAADTTADYLSPSIGVGNGITKTLTNPGGNETVTLDLDFGTGSGQVAEGDDSRFTDSRAPTGSAGGDLTGTYPNPTLAADRVRMSVFTTKGDVVVATGSATVTRLGVGTNGQYLTADSAESTGLKWVSSTTPSHALLSTTHSDTLAGTVVRGDVIVGNSTPAWSRLAKGAANTIFASDGTDVSWRTLTAEIDAAIGNTRGNILYRNGTVWTVLAPGTATHVLQTGGAGADPSWVVNPANDAELLALAGLASAADKFPYFTGSGTATLGDVSVFGRALIDDTDAAAAQITLGLGSLATLNAVGSGQITDGSVALADMADLATDRLIGRDTAGTGVPEALTVGGGVEFTGSGGIQRSALTGDVTATAGSGSTTIANDAVTYAKMQDVSATDRLLGRDTAGAGNVEEITASGALDMIGSTRGNILYRGATGWAVLAPGTSGHVLQTGGAGADPSWTAGGSGAPADAEYIVATANGTLSNERVLQVDADSSIDDGGTTITLGHNTFNGRMRRTGSTGIILEAYRGTSVYINGSNITLGAGIACATTDNRIAADGTDAGAALTTSTLYYVYVSNADASFAPSDVRCSTVAPSAYLGSLYLSASGNAANWRFVGWVRTNSSTQFVDTETDRLVVNYYNRRPVRLFTCPGYSNGNTQTTYTHTNTTWGKANAGTGSDVNYISNGEDIVKFEVHAVGVGGGGSSGFAVDLDGTDPTVCGTITAGVGERCDVSFSQQDVLAAGFYTASMLARVSSSTMTVYADDVRGGATADPAISYMIGWIMQ